jgi:hypothetical protein
MHLAILFSGRIDKFDVHHANIMERLVQDHTCDFFLSTVAPVDQVMAFCQLYRPVSVVNDPIEVDTTYESRRHPLTRFYNMMCMYCHRWRVFNELCHYMAVTQTHYDWVISVRLDALSDEPLPYDRFTRAAVLYIPEDNDWGGVNDQFCIGTLDAMASYMNVYPTIDRWLRTSDYGPETILRNHLEAEGAVVERFPFRYCLMNGKMFG